MRHYGHASKKSSVLAANARDWKSIVMDTSVASQKDSRRVNRPYRSETSSMKKFTKPSVSKRKPDSPPDKSKQPPTPQSNIASRVRSRRRHQQEAGQPPPEAFSRDAEETSSPSGNSTHSDDFTQQELSTNLQQRPQSFGNDRRSRRRQNKRVSTLAKEFGPTMRQQETVSSKSPLAPSTPPKEEHPSKGGDDDKENSTPNQFFESPRSFRARAQFSSLSISEKTESVTSLESIKEVVVPKDCEKKTRRRRKTKKSDTMARKGMTLDDIMDETVDPDEEFYHPDYIMHEAVLPTESGFQQNEMDQDDDGGYVPSWAFKSPRKRSRSEMDDSPDHSVDPSELDESPRKRQKPSPPEHVLNGLQRRTSSFGSEDLEVASTIRIPCDNTTGLLWTTPQTTLRHQRVFRLQQRSHSFYLAELLLQQDSEELQKLKQEASPVKLKTTKCDPCSFEPKRTRRKRVSVKFDGTYFAGQMTDEQAGLILYLLRMGADVNYSTQDTTSMLFLLVHYSNVAPLVSEMISRGADCQQRCTTDDVSILDVALRVGELQTIKTLLQHGALPTKHSVSVEPCRHLLSFAEQHGFDDFAFDQLREGFFQSVEDFDFCYTEGILAHGLNVDTLQENGTHKTALFRTVVRDVEEDREDDHVKMIKLLLSHGANPNAEDDIEIPMICYLLTRGRAHAGQILTLLLTKGARASPKVLDYATDVAIGSQYALLKQHIKEDVH